MGAGFLDLQALLRSTASRGQRITLNLDSMVRLGRLRLPRQRRRMLAGVTARTGAAAAPLLACMPTALPDSRLVIVTGKGGVGRSTVAAALATRLAGRGPTALLHPKEGTPVEPPPAPSGTRSPDVISIDRDGALETYITDQLPGPLAGALRASKAFRLMTAATPGLAELLTIGELKRLSEQYRHLVFDAPATGHILAMFDAPGRFERAAAVGPIARRAAELGSWLTDPAVLSTVVVTTGDGLAVSELLELSETLGRASGQSPALVVGNRVVPPSPSPTELAELEADATIDAAARAIIDRLAARARSERAQLGRITKQLGLPALQVSDDPRDPRGAVLDAFTSLDGAPA